MNINDEQAKQFLEDKEKSSGLFDETNTSLGNIKDNQKENSNDHISPNLEIGWKNIPLKNLPSRGLFYPEGTTFSIKAASATEIRHFSTIEEEDIFSVNEMLNMILDKCCKVKIPNKMGVNFRDIKDIDKFYLIFCIREITFKEGENKLFVDVIDPITNEVEKVEIRKDKFEYNTIDERIMQYYSPSKKCFVFKTTVGEIYLYIPSTGISNFFMNFLREKINNKENYDKAFIKIAPYLFLDWRELNNDYYKKEEKESLSWDKKKLPIINGLIEKLNLGLSSEMKHTTKSGNEVSVPITFQGGYKSIFLISDIFGELL